MYISRLIILIRKSISRFVLRLRYASLSTNGCVNFSPTVRPPSGVALAKTDEQGRRPSSKGFLKALWLVLFSFRIHIITLKKYLLSLIAPPVCAYCKTFLSERTVLCVLCKGKITPLVSVIIPVTKKYHMPVITVGEYKDPLKKLILSKGWSDYVASHELGQLIHELTPIQYMQFDLIVPIPLHWTRYAWRGYNQAEEMAKTLSEKLDIPYVNLLKRVRATPLQSSVVHTEREGNVKKVFVLNAVDRHKFKNKRILLVDDLMTTGATLQSAAKIIAGLQVLTLHSVVAGRVK